MRMLRRFTIVASLMLAAAFTATSVQAQTTVNTTTTSGATSAAGSTITLTSVTNVQAGAEFFIDREAMQVSAVLNTSTGSVQVVRGFDGTASGVHNSGATVYIGPASGTPPGSPFVFADPVIGSCTSTSEPFSLRINVRAGRIWQCTNSQWMNVVDAYVFVGPGACNSSVSGNSTGTNGMTVLGTAPSIPVVQAATSSTGTNTHYYTCSIPVPSRTNAVKAVYVVDVQFYYGVQTTALGTQVATLASGTMNSKTVFQSIGYPASAASETAAGLAEATRADSGTLTIAPVVGSFNTGTTTAGEFYSVTFTPANPFGISADRTQYLFTVSLLNTATSATVTNSPGFIVHYRMLQLDL